MSKFKVKMKIQGFELEVEGSREDVPTISSNLSRQLSGLLQPAGAIIEGDVVEMDRPAPPAAPLLVTESKKKPRALRKRAVATGQVDLPEVPQWRHDPAKYGMPSQAWNTATKAMWLIYVANAEQQSDQLTAKQIQTVFNRDFKQAGAIQAFNVTRDLGKEKVKKPSLVGEDTRQNPPAWYLTDAGRKLVQDKIAEALA